MPRKRINRSPHVEKRTDDVDDDDFLFDDSQSGSGKLIKNLKNNSQILRYLFLFVIMFTIFSNVHVTLRVQHFVTLQIYHILFIRTLYLMCIAFRIVNDQRYLLC